MTAAIEQVGVVGAGTMGREIALNLVRCGFPTVLVDSAAEVVEQADAHVRNGVERAVDKGRMSRSDADAFLACFTATTELTGLRDCDLVIEAIVEILDAKVGLFHELDSLVSGSALLATNTSSLRVSDLAAVVSNPGRVLGLHYFFPAAVNPLLEVVRTDTTDDVSVDRVLAFARRCGKTPLLCRDQYGFAVNRFFVPYLNESVRLLEDGFPAVAIERVAREELLASVGPFRIMDLSKTIIAVHAARTLEHFGPFYRPAERLVSQGESGEPWSVDEAADVDPGDWRTIRDRILGAVFLAVLQALDEAVAEPADFDAGARIALQWGAPPCQRMDGLGPDVVADILAPLLSRHGVMRPASLARVGRLLTG